MSFNPSRLSIVRKRRLFNKKKLAKSIGVNPHTIVLWERSRTVPTEENLNEIVRILDYPREFFFGADIDEPDKIATSFRSQTSMCAAMRDAALSAGAIGFLIDDWVCAKFDLPTSCVPDLHLLDPNAAARTLRQEWQLGEKPVSNMIHLLESKGIRVFSLAENTAEVNAYSLWRRGKPYVFLNTVKSAECSRFDAAHELAHLVLHQDGRVTGREAEDQAHQFAASFLMPRADILAEIPPITGLQKLIDAKRRWKVSLAALNYRVHKIGLVSDWKYRDFCIEIVRRKYNRNEPNEVERERSSVWEKVLKALWSEKTTHLDIAKEISVPPSEVGGLLFGVLNVASDQPKEIPRLKVMEPPIDPHPLGDSNDGLIIA